jgi:hypothetical protein
MPEKKVDVKIDATPVIESLSINQKSSLQKALAGMPPEARIKAEKVLSEGVKKPALNFVDPEHLPGPGVGPSAQPFIVIISGGDGLNIKFNNPNVQYIRRA